MRGLLNIVNSLVLVFLIFTPAYSYENDSEYEDDQIELVLPSAFDSRLKASVISEMFSLASRFDSTDYLSIYKAYSVHGLTGKILVWHDDLMGYTIIPLVRKEFKDNRLVAIEMVNSIVKVKKIERFSIPSSLYEDSAVRAYCENPVYYKQITPDQVSEYINEQSDPHYKFFRTMVGSEDGWTHVWVFNEWVNSHYIVQSPTTFKTYLNFLNSFLNVENWKYFPTSENLLILYNEASDAIGGMNLDNFLLPHAVLLVSDPDLAQEVNLLDYMEVFGYINFDNPSSISVSGDDIPSGDLKDISTFYLHLFKVYKDKIDFSNFNHMFSYKFFSTSSIHSSFSSNDSNVMLMNPEVNISFDPIFQTGIQTMTDLLYGLKKQDLKSYELLSKVIYNDSADIISKDVFVAPLQELGNAFRSHNNFYKLEQAYKELKSLDYKSIYSYLEKYASYEQLELLDKYIQSRGPLLSILLDPSLLERPLWIISILFEISKLSHNFLGLLEIGLVEKMIQLLEHDLDSISLSTMVSLSDVVHECFMDLKKLLLYYCNPKTGIKRPVPSSLAKLTERIDKIDTVFSKSKDESDSFEDTFGTDDCTDIYSSED